MAILVTNYQIELIDLGQANSHLFFFFLRNPAFFFILIPPSSFLHFTMTWQPDQTSLNQLLTILRDAINPNNKEQALIQQV